MPRVLVAVIAALIAAGCATAGPPRPFNVVETGIPELRQALADGRITSRQLVVEYLTRIALYEDQLKAIITVNPKVLEEADALDRERAQGGVRGPLHGIPIALKDNIHTTDMPTTGGAVAFEGYRPPYEATDHPAPAGGRGHHHRQDRAHRARQLGGGAAHADARQLQRAGRLWVQPLRPAP